MAKVTKLPHRKILSGFKGILDFYVHDGVACVRSWPKSPGKIRSPAVMAQWPRFRYAAKTWEYLPPEARRAYERMAQEGGLTGRTLSYRGFLKGLYRYEH